MDTDLELIMYTGTERVTLLRQRLIHSSFVTVVRPARGDARGKGETVARHPSVLVCILFNSFGFHEIPLANGFFVGFLFFLHNPS